MSNQRQPKMLEFKLNLEGTPEEQANIAKGGAITTILEMPANSKIRRINTRILQVLRHGIHPQTKEFGKFVEAEECVYLWAECDTDVALEKYRFHIVPTNGDLPLAYTSGIVNYLGTFLLQAGMYAFHVYGPEYVDE
jgi:hypothetical protein